MCSEKSVLKKEIFFCNIKRFFVCLSVFALRGEFFTAETRYVEAMLQLTTPTPYGVGFPAATIVIEK